MSFERSNIHSMQGYVPGEQPEAGDVIKLNTNENPYPAPAAVGAALAGIKVEDLRRYPSPTAAEFRRAVAARHGLTADQVVPTNGGDELLRLAVTTFTAAEDKLAIAVPSYSLYPVLADIQGCELLTVPLQEDWQLPADFAATLNRAGVRLAMLVNPHAPSGCLTSVAEIARIAGEFKGVLLIDEAYVDFVDPTLEHDLLPLLKDYPNLLLLRTLSKGYSLAGLRCGYGLGCQTLIEPMLFKTRDSYNTDYITQRLATAAIAAAAEAGKTWLQVRAARGHLKQSLEKLGFSCPDSQSNFLLATVPEGADASRLYHELKQRKILVRYFDQDRLRDKLRITVGTPLQNEQLLRHLREILQL